MNFLHTKQCTNLLFLKHLFLAPSFDEAIKMPMPENSAMMQQSTSNLGWNVSTPSAPIAEKNNL